MPSPVRHPALAVVGLAVIALLCVQLLRGAVTLETAAQRALLTVVVLAVTDRVAIPLGRALLGPAKTDEIDESPADNAEDEDRRVS
jgi:hypothetical protein